jgi:5-methylcytosine-specific restriction endonuclease McrA
MNHIFNFFRYAGKRNIISGLPRAPPKISKRTRDLLWRSTFNSLDGHCYVCQNTIGFDKFEAGHIIARANGGNDTLSNLRPICSACNRSMGTKNMDEFKQSINKDIKKTIFPFS